jgi:hypothetical protein
MTKIEFIGKNGISAAGKRALIKYLENKHLTFKEAILAKCYDCMGHYGGGKIDCMNPACPLYFFMPYRENKVAKEEREDCSHKDRKQIETVQKSIKDIFVPCFKF